MTKAFSYFASAVLMLSGLLSSCSKDEPGMNEGFYHPELGWIGASGNVAGVESEAGPQNGQKHRSSGNFSTSGLIDGDYYYWELDSVARADGVYFRVMKDVKAGSDPVIEEYVTHGSLTRVYKSDKLYIADPKNAKRSFKVTVASVKGGEGSLYVTCAKDHQEGQSHRASANFDFSHTLYEVVLPNNNISFTIQNDRTGGGDLYLYKNVSNGRVIAKSTYTNLYISDVKGAEGPFTVQFKPVVRDWMSNLPDYTLLTELSIPGTHDTGTYNCDPGLAKCQNFSIEYQLEFGIRAFDIRFDSEMDIRHGLADCGIDMEDVLEQMNNFLFKHPRECIIMILNQHDDEDYPHLKEYFEKNPSSVHYIDRNIVSLANTYLHEARGKIILIRRFPKPDSSCWGIDFTDWPDDCAKGYHRMAENGAPLKYYIQDRYFSADEAIHDTPEKTRLVKETFEAAATGDNDCLYINYNSVAGRLSTTPWQYAWTRGSDHLPIDPMMMESLSKNLSEVRATHPWPCRLGIVMLDFFNKHGNDDPFRNTETVINSNFSQDRY